MNATQVLHFGIVLFLQSCVTVTKSQTVISDAAVLGLLEHKYSLLALSDSLQVALLGMGGHRHG